MANKKEVYTSIASCKAYGDEHGISFADTPYIPKRIYTIEEATAIASHQGNTFKLKCK